MFEERIELAKQRIGEISNLESESVFGAAAKLLEKCFEVCDQVLDGSLYNKSLEELQKLNLFFYEELLGENYEESYANPAFCVEMFGVGNGEAMAFLYSEIRAAIICAYEGNKAGVLKRAELFLEVHTKMAEDDGSSPVFIMGSIKESLYYYFNDYQKEEVFDRLSQTVCPERDTFATDLIMKSDLSDIRFLYFYGEYVADNQIKTLQTLNKMSDKELDDLASTFTEGYRIGFEVTNKDISLKDTVNIRFNLGFEPVIRRAIVNFREIGLNSTIYRKSNSLFEGGLNRYIGYMGEIPNRQYEYDHKDDLALILDGDYLNTRYQAYEEAYEKLKKECSVFGGPAVLETFGEIPFEPVIKPYCHKLSEKQQKQVVENTAKLGTLQNKYIKGEERSFTIMALPVPSISESSEIYEQIFHDTTVINTLDYKMYQEIQQSIIDCLDQCEKVHILGAGNNHTDLVVALNEIDNTKETNFENCVADVNIPLGEVFTSPVLKGTDGVLHVTKVFLNGLEYKDLELVIRDGEIISYTSKNFADEEKSKEIIKDNILYHHDTLPMGEFAIGTNTTAFAMGRKYNIEQLLPILIAEKTGPHFAFGDTCYSHEENVKSYNPDGKEIVAKANTYSKAGKYFNCHTDITIPYDELKELSAIRKDGSKIAIIENGRFVAPKTEKLNESLS